jgi:hypothetical protein
MFLGSPGLGIGRTGMRGGGFSPTDIPGLALWLDPSDSSSITLVGGKVSQIADKSGNARHYSQSTDANRPTIASAAINGRDALQFVQASQQYLIGPSFAALTAAHAFIVTKTNVVHPGVGGLWNFGSPADSGYFTFFDEIYDSFGSTTRQSCGSVGTTMTSPHALDFVSTSSKWQLSIDGVVKFTTGTNTVGWAASSFLGRNATTGTTYHDGLIGEVLIYDHELTASEYTKLIARWW